jgi:adenosylmethionine-8-amino-7-oxononanoate aminotransferase
LETAEGEQLIDASSSWWVNTIGHGRPEIARAIAAQQQRLDHVLFAGATHAPAAQLAQKVLALAGPPFEKGRVFYSDNGSTAVEVALKIAYQEHAQKGQPQRRLFISFEGSYHGDTFGAMAVARAEGFHGIFAPLFFESRCLPLDLAQVSACLAQEATVIAAVIIEPLLQGAGGMKIHSPAFLQGLAALTKQYGIPLILDEVFTGLGRLGANFAFQRAGVRPDLLCVAKGLTGGNLPLAMTLATQRSFEAFLDEDKSKALLHGHSYTANPIACAAALAALDIFVSEDLAGRARVFEAHYQTWIAEHTPFGLRNPRAIGGVLAFEWPGSGAGDYFHQGMQAVPVVARRQGLFLRTLGNTVYFMPPLATDDATLKKGLHALSQTLRTLIQIPHG